ncbi:putative lipoprotein YiaD [uncultured bacterium]|nr:putative lipoprotein YiaD [uncultured bacterium]
MKQKLLIAAIGTILLTACTSQGGMSSTAIGGLSGAAVGAGVGTLFGGNDLKNAGFGALAGGAVGAAIGAYMDSQEQEMQQSLQGTGIQVQRTAENTLNLTMPSNVTFATGSAALTPQAQQSLNSVRDVLNHYPESTITVTGHTDDVGKDRDNQVLSEQRAASVANYLAQQGVNRARLHQQGMGESQPKVPNTSDMNRAQNRRVELAIVANNNAGANQQNAPQQQPQPQQYPQQAPQQGYPQQQYPQQYPQVNY